VSKATWSSTSGQAYALDREAPASEVEAAVQSHCSQLIISKMEYAKRSKATSSERRSVSEAVVCNRRTNSLSTSTTDRMTLVSGHQKGICQCMFDSHDTNPASSSALRIWT